MHELCGKCVGMLQFMASVGKGPFCDPQASIHDIFPGMEQNVQECNQIWDFDAEI